MIASTSSLPQETSSAGVDQARAAVDQARSSLPYPDDVLDCLVAAVATKPELYLALRNPGKGKGWPEVQKAAAACVVQIRSGPRFAEDLQRAAGGKLSEEQVACAAREYGALSPEQIEAASGAVLNPQEAEPADTAPIKQIYETCGVKAGG